MDIVTLAYSDTLARSNQCHYRRAHLYSFLVEITFTSSSCPSFSGVFSTGREEKERGKKGTERESEGEADPNLLFWPSDTTDFK